MPFGVGGGVNLGAATVFLFVDATGMRKNLLQAEKDLADFEKKRIAAANAVAKSTAASTAATSASAIASNLTDPAFLALQKKQAQAVQQATLDIQRSYALRDAALEKHAAVVEASGAAEAAELKNLRTLNAQLAAAEKARATIVKTLTQPATVVHPLTGATVANPLAPNARQELVASLNLKETQQQINQLTADIAASEAKIAGFQGDVAASAKMTAAEVVAANDLQAASFKKLQIAVSQEVATLEGFAAGAGPAFSRLGAGVAASGQALIANIKKVEQAESELNAARTATSGASGAELEAAVQAEQAAFAKREAALATLTASEERYAATKAKLTDAIIANDQKLAASAVAAAEKAAAASDASAAAGQERAATQLTQGLNAVQGVAFATGAAVGIATKQFADFESEMAKSAAIAPSVDKNIAAITDTIDQLAVSLGQSPAELAKGLNEIVQADIGINDATQAMNLLALASKAAVAGNTDVETALKPLIGIMNAYHLTVEQLVPIQDQLFKGVTAGIFSFQDLAQQMGDNLSIASALGVNVDELVASYIVLTKRSNNLAESTTQVNAVMNSFLKPSDALNKAVKELTGEEATLYFRTHSLGEVLQLVEVMFQKNADAAGQLFPNIRAIRGIFGLTSQEGAAYEQELAKVDSASLGAGVASQVLGRQMQTTSFAFSQATQELAVAAIKLGAVVAPSVLKAAQGIGAIADSFNRLPEGARNAVGGVLVLVAGLTGMIAVISHLVGAFNTLRGAFNGLTLFLQESEVAMGALALLTNPLVLGLAAVAAIAGVLYVKHQQQASAVQAAADAYKGLNDQLKENLKSGQFTANQLEQQAKFTDIITKAAFDRANAFHDLTQQMLALQDIHDKVFNGQNVADTEGLLGTKGAQLTFEDLGRITDRLNNVRAALDSIQHEDPAAFQSISTDLTKILSDPNLDFNKFLDDFKKQADIDFGTLPNGGKVFADWVHGIASDASDYVKNAKTASTIKIFPEGTSSFTDLKSFFSGATDNLDEFQKALQKITIASETTAGAAADITDPFKFVAQQFGEVDATANQLVLTMNALGNVNLTPAQKQALDVANAMDLWQQKIDAVNQKFTDSQNRINAATQAVSESDNAIGNLTDGYNRLNEMLRKGLITQQEYDRIRQAGNIINQNAVKVKTEEGVAQAKLLPQLAQDIQQHQAQVDAYNALTPAQQAFVTSLNDEKNVTILMTTIMLKLAEAMGAIPKEVTTKFIADVTQADPAARTVLDDLGLIPPEVQTQLTVDDSKALNPIGAVQKRLDELKASLNDPDVINNPVRINEIQDAIAKLQQEAADIVVAPNVDFSQIKQGKQAFLDFANTAKIGSDEFHAAMVKANVELKSNDFLLRQMARDSLPKLFDALKPSLSDPMAFLTRGMGTAEQSIEDVILKVQDLNNSPLKLAPAQVAALRTSDTLNELTDALKQTTDAIGNASTEISTFQGYVSLVDDTLGSGKNTLANYQKQLALGKIKQQEFNQAVKSGDAAAPFAKANDLLHKGLLTQTEYNAAVSAGTQIKQLSKTAIDQENAAIAKSLPTLLARIKAQRNADLAYQSLTGDQKDFITGIQQEGVQQALTTTLMIAQLEALGVVAQGMTQKFAKAESTVNPFFSQIAKDLGLLDKQNKFTISVDTKVTGASAGKTIADKAGQDLTATDRTIKQHTDQWKADTGAAGTQAGNDFAANLAAGISAKQGDIDSAATSATASLSGMYVAATVAGNRAGAGFDGGVVASLHSNTASITTAGADATNALAGNNAIADNLGKGVGQQFVLGIAGAIRTNRNSIATEIIGPDKITGILHDVSSEPYGEFVGKSYVVGILKGVNDPTYRQLIETSGKGIALDLEKATLAQLQAHSPSKRGIYAGQTFSQGVAIGVEQGGDQVAASAKGVADSLATGMTKAAGDAGKQAASSFGTEFGRQVKDFIVPGAAGFPATNPNDFLTFTQAVNNAKANLGQLYGAFITNKGINGNVLKTLPQDWQDAFSSMAQSISSFGGLTKDQSKSLTTLFNGLMQKNQQFVQQGFAGLPDAIKPAVRDFVATINEINDPSSFQALQSAFNGAAKGASQLGKSASDLPQELRNLSKQTDAVKASARDYLNLMLNKADPQQITDAFLKMQQAIGDPHTVAIIQKAAVALRKGVPKGFQMDSNFNFFPTDAQNSANAQADKVGTNMGQSMTNALGASFDGTQFVNSVGQVGMQAGTAAGSSFTDGLSQAQRGIQQQQKNAGQTVAHSFLDGFMMGTGETFPQFMARMAQLGPSIIASVNKSLGIASPSKKFRDIGINVGKSFTDSAYKTLVAGAQRFRDAAKIQTDAYQGELQKGMKQVHGGQPIGSTRHDLKLTRAAHVGGGGRNTTVHAPIGVNVNVSGVQHSNPQQLADTIKQEVWNNLVDSIGRVWTQAEGAV